MPGPFGMPWHATTKKAIWTCCGDEVKTLPVWVTRHAAFDHLQARHPGASPPLDSPFVLYLVIGKAPCTPDPFHVQAYIGLASNGWKDRWTGHKTDIKRLLRARGDHVLLTRLVKEMQLVDTSLAVLASQGALADSAYLFLVSAHATQTEMEDAEKEWRSNTT